MFVKIKENQDSHQKKTRARLFSTAEVRKTGWLTAAGHCTKAGIETADRTPHLDLQGVIFIISSLKVKSRQV